MSYSTLTISPNKDNNGGSRGGIQGTDHPFGKNLDTQNLCINLYNDHRRNARGEIRNLEYRGIYLHGGFSKDLIYNILGFRRTSQGEGVKIEIRTPSLFKILDPTLIQSITKCIMRSKNSTHSIGYECLSTCKLDIVEIQT